LIFDSFRDMPLTSSPTEVAATFTATSFPDPTKEPEAYSTALKSFINTHFLPVESDLIEPYASNPLPPPPPGWLPNVTTPTVHEWATALHNTWGTLCRTAAPDVSQNPSLYSLLPVPGPFIVPGARFREGYYWDSYWAIQGLLVSGLDSLAKNVVLNLIHCVKTHGFVPNGLRSYYLNRSQPPLLAVMVEAVWESTQDVEFLRNAVPALDVELMWWREEPRSSMVCIKTFPKAFLVSRYCANWKQPRPESFKEDLATVTIALAKSHNTKTNTQEEPKINLKISGHQKNHQLEEKHHHQNSPENINNTIPTTEERIFCDIASAAESGWDFSSRWFEDGKSLSTIRTSQIYPADLNALLYRAEKTTARLAQALLLSVAGLSNKEKEDTEKLIKKWSDAAEERFETMTNLHWDPETNRWRDFVLVKKNSTNDGGDSDLTIKFVANRTDASPSTTAIYASDFVPLWCGCAPANSPQALLAVQSFKKSNLISVGGVAASTLETGEQWDWPNAWPPLQSMLAEGCERYGGTLGAKLAEEIARKYLKTALSAWTSTGKMFEKFDARKIGVQGGGGEYACMEGFGWTNGVALMWLDKYGWRDSETM
jgi:alpha,alpha-trehalase